MIDERPPPDSKLYKIPLPIRKAIVWYATGFDSDELKWSTLWRYGSMALVILSPAIAISMIINTVL